MKKSSADTLLAFARRTLQ